MMLHLAPSCAHILKANLRMISKKWIRIGLGVLTLIVCIALDSSRVSAEVTIASFNAQSGAGQIKLVWTTASERKNWGFNIERSTDQKNWLHVGSNPSTKSQSPCIQNLMGASYELTDSGLTAGVKYYYRLQSYGQPCGDPNTYYEQIVSVVVNAPMVTPTLLRTASPTATLITPAVNLPTPTATKLPLPTIIPGRTPPSAATTPTKTPPKSAVAPSRPVPTLSDQNAARLPAPSIQPPPSVAARLASREEPIESDESAPLAPQSRMVDRRDLIRGGVVIVTVLLGIASLVCGTLALYVILCPRR